MLWVLLGSLMTALLLYLAMAQVTNRVIRRRLAAERRARDTRRSVRRLAREVNRRWLEDLQSVER